jgi:hypothetical protein
MSQNSQLKKAIFSLLLDFLPGNNNASLLLLLSESTYSMVVFRLYHVDANTLYL